MKKLLSKATAYLLALAVVLGVGSWSAVSMPVMAAESSIVNVYDATTFGEMLKTENVDIMLWQDINYTGSDKVVCNSIDLNGYDLTCSNTLTFGSGKRTFSILDGQYNESEQTSTGTATFQNSINISDGTLRIESGVVRISPTGSSACVYGTGNVEFINGTITIAGISHATEIGQKGSDGKDGGPYKGSSGESGISGGTGIDVDNVFVYGGRITIQGGDGGSGGNGGGL